MRGVPSDEVDDDVSDDVSDDIAARDATPSGLEHPAEVAIAQKDIRLVRYSRFVIFTVPD